ncbi:hypothetical protein ACIPPM_13645 [Streptomyces sp. NPDC090119]|uniref:hypothetical protein n=1 Tax=Streptomyces sp. NPDC090119 TaxID=3365951 RepID=UPI0037FB100C
MSVEPDLRAWAQGEAANARWFADALGVPPEVYGRDPASLVPTLRDHVSRAPFAERDGRNRRRDRVRLVGEGLSGLPLEITRLPARAEAAPGLRDG